MIVVVFIGVVVVFLIVMSVLDRITSGIDARRLDAARREYESIEARYGPLAGREHCPHRVVTFGQTGTPGVVALTSKWCRVCGANLGPAKLRKTIFGSRWT